MSPVTTAGHRKIIHVGIDAPDSTANNSKSPPPQIQPEFATLLREYTDLVELAPVDTATLDVTYNRFEIPFGVRIAKMIKGDLKRQLGLRVSLGLAPTKFLARLAMESKRPDGMTVVLPEQIAEFLAEVDIERLPGVGPITCQRLSELKVDRVGQLSRMTLAELIHHFGQRGKGLWLLAQGRDNDPVAPAEEVGQIGEEALFDAPIYRRDEIHEALRSLTSALSGRLRRRALRGRVAILQVHYPDLRATAQTSRLPDFTDGAQTLFNVATQLLDLTEAHSVGLRRISINLGGFAGEVVEQLDLFANADPIDHNGD